jgi:phospholipid-binding lipoprotein MlaA
MKLIDKFIYCFILASVFVLLPVSLRADTSLTTPDTVQSDSRETLAASQVLAGTNEETGTALPEQEEPVVKTALKESDENKDDATEGEEEAPRIADPLAPINRVMFNVNDKLYFWALKPVTQVYSHIIPEDFRIIFSNVYDNLWAPSRVLNNLMQLRLKAAGNELIRFLFNSLAGIGGAGDVARDALGIKKQEADFGQTLGHYGIGHGFYLVFPALGPSSLRDGVGLVGDYFMYPLTYVSRDDLTFWQATAIHTHEVINDTSFKIGDYETFKSSAIDPYVSMRDAYIQHRKKVVDESNQ